MSVVPSLQAFADFVEFLFVFCPETFVDALVFHRPLLRPTGEFDFSGMLSGLPMEVDLVATGGFDHAGLSHGDVAFSFAADS